MSENFNRVGVGVVATILLCAGVVVPVNFAGAAEQTAPAGTPTQAGTASETDETGAPFDIWEYQVAGNTLLPTEDIERAVYGHLGPHKTIKDVEAAQKALEALYQKRGYGTVFVDIPEQDVSSGVVTLKVTEGQVERLRVTGSRYFSLGRIKARVPSLAKGKVPHLPDVQKELAALNSSSPDRVITPVLRPGMTPGKVEVELKVKDELPLHGSLDINDRYTADTTRLRLNGTIRYDNLWQREHSVSVSYQVSPEDPNEVEVFSGTYLFRSPFSDHLLALYGVSSSTDVATVGTLGVIGSGVIGGARYIIPLKSLDNYFHNVTLGADYKDFSESIALQGSDSLNTPISYLMFSTQYSGTWLTKGATTHLNVGVNFALRGLGNTQKEFENKRFNADPNFAYLRASFDRTQPLIWNASLFVRMRGQVSNSPLISNEQFSAGGVDSVRGYLESQVLADDGIDGTLELRSPSLAEYVSPELSQLQLLTFVDGAAMRVRQALPSQASDYYLWSAGIGMKLTARKNINAALFWAWPFQTAGTTVAGDSRLHFDVGYQF
jgi:hemolysin activation/secretion protein